MTNQEAIRILNQETSEEALKELEYYRCGLSSESIRENALHTALKMAIEALEKQIAKEPEDYVVETTMNSIIQEWTCPNCGAVHFCDYRQKYCSECSQKIDWRDYE